MTDRARLSSSGWVDPYDALDYMACDPLDDCADLVAHAFCRGAAVAFGLMGMAEAIQQQQPIPSNIIKVKL